MIRSRLSKKDSEEVAEVVDNFYATIAGSTAQLAFVKGKLLAYKNMKRMKLKKKQ